MGKPIDNILDRLRGRGDVKQQGHNWRCLCPAHDDKSPSLDVAEGKDGRVILCCRSRNCSAAQITGAMGLTIRDLFNGTMPDVDRLDFAERVQATYDYHDEDGKVLFQSVRLWAPPPKGKDFRQRRPKPGGGWEWKLGDARRVLYRLPELRAAGAADVSTWVFVVEGEKDADALARLGLVATTNPMGAGKWKKEYAEQLRGRRVAVIPDNDAPGREHADAVIESLRGVAFQVVRLELPGLPEKGDVSDWLVAGGTAADLTTKADALLRRDPVGAAVGNVKPNAGPASAPRPGWPKLDAAAMIGPAGELVRAIEPHTEADPVAILLQTLVGFGSIIGRTAHYPHEADRHYGNEFLVLVGETADGRKGTSWGHARRALAEADSEWAAERIARGLSSGEGLIHEVRDARKDDGGVSDKRLLVMENEFASVLKQTERQGNTLSPVLRQAWEGGELRTMTKNTPARCAEPHISTIGHITPSELHRYLTATEVANGLGNRHLFACVRRSKMLPEGGTPDAATVQACGREIGCAAAFARQVRAVCRTDEARGLWRELYPRLSSARPGLVGCLAARCLAHVCRLSMLYALLDREAEIGVGHLRAAVAVWDYCEASLAHIFGRALGDPTADQIREALLEAPDGLSRTEIRNLFARHKTTDEIGRALDVLLRWRVAEPREVSTGGRPAERWFAARA